MKALRQMSRKLKSLHKDEQGADMVEYVLLIAVIALPLLAVAVYFRNEIWEKVKDFWNQITGDIDVPDN